MKIREEEYLAEIQKSFYVNNSMEFSEALAHLLLAMIKDKPKPTLEKGSYRVKREDADYFIVHLRTKGITIFMEFKIVAEKERTMLLEFHEWDIWN